jgi:hypothetical protein
VRVGKGPDGIALDDSPGAGVPSSKTSLPHGGSAPHVAGPGRTVPRRTRSVSDDRANPDGVARFVHAPRRERFVDLNVQRAIDLADGRPLR